MLTINTIADEIGKINPLQGKKIAAYLQGCDGLFFERANKFFARYELLLHHLGKDLAYGVDCYNNMIADMVVERIEFLRTGRYSNSSFEDVNTRLYNHPNDFDHHMHGLFLAQFLWWDQYQRFSFFSDNLKIQKPVIKRYLEIGAGHGLYINEATEIIGEDCIFDLVDISPVSLEMCKVVLAGKKINFVLQDIYEWSPEYKYDFITIGEVVEHLEDPHSMLRKIGDFLNDDGVIYITTPANAPMIDHIYLFNDAAHIKGFIHECGYEILNENYVYAENMEEKKAIKNKVPLMYAAFIKKLKTP